jgi:hypothetical protein
MNKVKLYRFGRPIWVMNLKRESFWKCRFCQDLEEKNKAQLVYECLFETKEYDKYNLPEYVYFKFDSSIPKKFWRKK